jgi:two-component system sensor histidine kinase KdpD
MPLARRSALVGSIFGLVWIAVAVAVLVPLRAHASRATPALVLVLGVVLAGLLGGAVSAAVAAVVSATVLNLAFIPPYGTFKVDAAEDWIALAVFLAVAMAVGLLVASEADRRRAAEQREAELRSLYDELNRVTAERAQLADEAARAQVLARVDEQRSALLRSVSHDLRTPLATIRAVATDLRDGDVYDDATRAELLGTVCDESERLDRIVANLLSLSRIEAGALTPERQAVPVDELVGERLRRLAPLFRRARIEVDVPTDLPLVDADYTQLDLVLTNLLENAARHAPVGSTVRLTARRRDAMVEVRVADEGIGVPEWAGTTIFEPFRLGVRGGSSGVGLAISKAIVEAHGGKIWVERTVGGGATFAFTVPVRAPVRR